MLQSRAQIVRSYISQFYTILYILVFFMPFMQEFSNIKSIFQISPRPNIFEAHDKDSSFSRFAET